MVVIVIGRGWGCEGRSTMRNRKVIGFDLRGSVDAVHAAGYAIIGSLAIETKRWVLRQR
jgi:hypothetical protein